MASRYRLTSVETVESEGSWAFTARNADGEDVEILLVPCESAGGPPIEAWVNRCTHENQRLYRDGVGAVTRGGEVVCPKHGSAFDVCSGSCDNGPAADSTLFDVGIEVDGGQVYLTDEDLSYLREGLSDDDDGNDGPGSTSHLRF
jgi:nitrite reductase/ring-hydroxylating ferredoxin subunit